MNATSRSLRAMAVLLCLCAALPLPAAAQTAATGNIEGLITDASGGVLPGVPVTVRNQDTNVVREAVTETSGRYRVSGLPPGVYEVSATLSGFDVRPIGNVEVRVGQTVPVDLVMRPAGVAETVNVAAEAPALDTRRTDLSNVIGRTEMANLPVVGRRWDNFVLLSPGVTNDGNFGLISYRGISGLYNNNMVDGVDNNQAFFSDARGRNRIAYSISEAAIKEFQVGVSNMSAEFGRAAGGTVNAVTRSGGNTFSGEAFYFIRDDALQAANPLITTGKPDERRQQFGGAFGGPLVRDRAFFFVNYDQQVRNFPAFTAPSGATFFASTCATAPAANCEATRAFYQSLNVLNDRSGDNKVVLGKVDVSINPSQLLSVTVNSHRWDSENGVQTQPIISVAQSANGSDIVKTDFVVASLSSVFGQRWLNELRVQVGRDYESQTPNSPGPSTTVTNGISFGMPNFLPRPAYPHELRYQFIDAVTYYRGAHSVKMGADINYVKEKLINLFQGGGVYAYPNLNAIALDCPIGAAGCTPTGGRNYTSFAQAFDLNGLNGRLDFNQLITNFYVQDTWRVNDALVLNLGVRYEYQQMPQPGEVEVEGVTFNGNSAYPQTQRIPQDSNNWGPRVGAAYDVGGRHDTVVRGGYGVFYGLTSNSAVANALLNNAVNQATYQFTPSTAGAPIYPNVFSAPPTISGNRPDLNVIEDDFQRPTIHMADLTLDQRVYGDTIVSVSYLFSRGRNLPIFKDINLPAASATVNYFVEGQQVGSFPFYRGVGGTANARPDSNVGRIIELQSSVTSTYHAMVLAANKRFADGLLFNASYTLSKAKDRGQNSQTFFASFSQVYDPFNPDLADGEAPSDFDRRHRFVGSAVYRPEFLWGIGVSGVATLESGLPVSRTISGNVSSATGAANTVGTNGTGGANFAPWLGRNSERQSGRKTIDLRVSKQFAAGQGARVEVLWEAFNVFNWRNYTGASSTAFNVSSSSYDAASSTVTVNLTPNSGFNVPTTIGNTLFGMRDMQIGLKLYW
jgi:hypothetical protein